MKIGSFFNSLMMGNLANKRAKNTKSSGVLSAKNIARAKKISAEVADEIALESPAERMTYDLKILKEMDDLEYFVFEETTAKMSHGERMLAAQMLYRFTKYHENLPQNAPPPSPRHAHILGQLGIDSHSIEKFLTAYKHNFERHVALRGLQ